VLQNGVDAVGVCGNWALAAKRSPPDVAPTPSETLTIPSFGPPLPEELPLEDALPSGLPELPDEEPDAPLEPPDDASPPELPVEAPDDDDEELLPGLPPSAEVPDDVVHPKQRGNAPATTSRPP